jgi:hypothetical protein
MIVRARNLFAAQGLLGATQFVQTLTSAARQNFQVKYARRSRGSIGWKW